MTVSVLDKRAGWQGTLCDPVTRVPSVALRDTSSYAD